LKISEKIELIIYILESCKKDVGYYHEKLKLSEKEQTDLYHELEGVSIYGKGKAPTFKERAKIATRLQKALFKRRIAKDQVRLNDPLLILVENEIGSKFLNHLRQVLGETRKIEKQLDDRVYSLRSDEDDRPSNPALEKSLNQLISQWKSDVKK